ncbi:MAG: hypothetical protein HEQ33_08170 [Dolichospermum sp. WA123]|nr:hypothetical protein [Dolichospermum sp. WA123]
MSAYQRTIQAFVQVIKSEPALFSPEDWLSITELMDSLPDDSEEIANGIRKWLKLESRSQIKQAFDKKRQEIPGLTESNNTLFAGGATSPTPPNQPSKLSQELIKNPIKLNSPLSDDKKSQPKP